jgi:hypothetical protein
VAQVELFGEGGDFNYIFWDGAGFSSDPAPITLHAAACQPARHLAGVSSAGQAVTTEIVLQSPYCP